MANHFLFLVHMSQGPLPCWKSEGQDTLTDSCSKTMWNREGNGVPWRIPLAGQINILLHLLPFCMFPLSRLIHLIPRLQTFLAGIGGHIYDTGLVNKTSCWGLGERVLEKLFVFE